MNSSIDLGTEKQFAAVKQFFNESLVATNAKETLIGILFLEYTPIKKINFCSFNEQESTVPINNKIRQVIRKTDAIFSLVHNQFIIFIKDAINREEINIAAQRILQAIMQPIYNLQQTIYLNCYIGISLYPYDASDLHSLAAKANIALYRAKIMGRTNLQFYGQTNSYQVRIENQTEIDLRHAINNNELTLHYQPIFDADYKLSYLEALVRWQHPKRGLLSPLVFIPHAEKTGLILLLGEWIIKTVCQQLNKWQRANYHLVPIAINVSGLQFRQQLLSNIIKQYVEQFSIEAKNIELEFTESVLIEHTDKIKHDISELKKLHVKLAIDDFGTYYSNLSYLKYLAVDKIKIDQTFIRDLQNSVDDRQVINAIIAMAHSLNLKVVAEGVETKHQAEYLREHNIDALQGFYFSKPVSADICTHLLNKIKCHII